MPASDSLSFSTLKDKLVWSVLVFIGFWLFWLTQRSIDQPSEDRVTNLIEQNAPYLRDRAVILARIDDLRSREPTLLQAIRENTKEIQSMRIDIEKLLIIKPSDVLKKIGEVDEKLASIVERLVGSRPPPSTASN